MFDSKGNKVPAQIYNCIIIGAGISGITFAHKLSIKGEAVLVLEKEHRVGGQINTFYSQDKAGTWAEAGSHTCYNSYTHLLSVADEVKHTDSLLPLRKCRYVIFDENRLKRPFGLISMPRMMLNGWRCFFLSMKGKTVRQYFGRIVGKGNYNRLFTYMFRAVISQEADDYPAEIFLKRRKGRRKDLPRKFSFKGGLSSFIDRIIRTDKLNVQTGVNITSVAYKEGLYEIGTSSGAVFHSENLVIATHTSSAAELMKEIDTEASAWLKDIAVSYSETITILAEGNKIKADAVAGIIPTSNEFNSAVSNDASGQDGLRGFSFHFPKGGKSHKDKIETACKVLGISSNDIIDYSFTTHILPAMRMKNLGIMKKIDGKNYPHLFLIGNYYYGVSMEDCVQRATEEAARYLRQKAFCR